MDERSTPGPQTFKPSTTGASDVGGDQPGTPNLLEQMGGVTGIISSIVPVVVFIVVNNLSGMMTALWASLACAVAIFIWRIVRKENLQPAFSALFGVAIGAGIAYFTGEAKGYYLYGIWMSLVLAVAFLLSTILKWPLIGVIWLSITGHGMAWRKIPAARLCYTWATLAWAVVFFLRFIVQNKLYENDETTMLGIARLAMGLPLTAVVVILTIWMVKKASKIIEAHEDATGEIILKASERNVAAAAEAATACGSPKEERGE